MGDFKKESNNGGEAPYSGKHSRKPDGAGLPRRASVISTEGASHLLYVALMFMLSVAVTAGSLAVLIWVWSWT